jgi:acetyl esterase/lipase
MKTPRLLVLLALAFLAAPLFAQEKAKAKTRAKPAPALANVHYGTHERHVLDLWKAKSEKPTPLVVFIHGGGFRAGSKDQLSVALLEGLLAKGISVMAIN